MRSDAPQTRSYLLLLSLTALGVVYGDIGTSPLYALRECFGHHYGPLAVNPLNVLGVLSLIFWALVLIISVEYMAFVLRADNRGEGGILALAALVSPVRGQHPSRRLLVLLALFGGAMIYGDGMITPAISVLSAVEGLKVATPVFEPYVIPITIAILIALFVLQSRGTAGIGMLFGPVTLTWFVVIGLLGLAQIVREPQVLAAVNPLNAWAFFAENKGTGFLVLGSVFLVVTGGEALYADIGHFGVKPVRYTWFTVVLPCLLLNYFGQGALLLQDPSTVDNPFYRLAPTWGLYPLVALATLATAVASQAVITGAFSLTMQAVQLGYCPRMTIKHTSAREMGQIYMPFVNWTLMIAAIGLVLGFRSSSNLAAAYGIAVTTTMVITTTLFFVVAWRRWQWRLPMAALILLVFLPIDLSFWGANIVKVPQGGWFPIVVAAFVFLLMTTWKRGRAIVGERIAKQVVPLDAFLKAVAHDPPTRVPGTAVFMYSNPTGTPPALLHNLKHNRVLHQQVVVLNVQTAETPHVTGDERVRYERIQNGFSRVILRFGFMDEPDIPRCLASIPPEQLKLEPENVTYFLGRENLIASPKAGLTRWREQLFVWMSRNAQAATTFFRLPPNRVVELGAQIEL